MTAAIDRLNRLPAKSARTPIKFAWSLESDENLLRANVVQNPDDMMHRGVLADYMEEQNGNRHAIEQLRRQDIKLAGYSHAYGHNLYVFHPGGTEFSTAYTLGTDPQVMRILDRARDDQRIRIRVHYGHTDGPQEGRDWLAENDVSGTVGRSAGTYRTPILIHNTRSMGGSPILTHCIVKIRGVGGRVLYQHPYYHHGVVTMGPSPAKGYSTGVFVDGDNHANFRDEAQAHRWIRRMGLTLSQGEPEKLRRPGEPVKMAAWQPHPFAPRPVTLKDGRKATVHVEPLERPEPAYAVHVQDEAGNILGAGPVYFPSAGVAQLHPTVFQEHRRLGVATHMYQAAGEVARHHGGQLQPTATPTPAAQGVWDKMKTTGVKMGRPGKPLKFSAADGPDLARGVVAGTTPPDVFADWLEENGKPHIAQAIRLHSSAEARDKGVVDPYGHYRGSQHQAVAHGMYHGHNASVTIYRDPRTGHHQARIEVGVKDPDPAQPPIYRTGRTIAQFYTPHMHIAADVLRDLEDVPGQNYRQQPSKLLPMAEKLAAAREKGRVYANFTALLNGREERQLSRNRRIFEHNGHLYLQLHGTTVVAAHPDGTLTLRHGGWNTPTTHRTIREYTGIQTGSVKSRPVINHGAVHIPFFNGIRVNESGHQLDEAGNPLPLPEPPAPRRRRSTEPRPDQPTLFRRPVKFAATPQDHEQFRNAIMANPKDGNAHGAYADFLEEHGYPAEAMVIRRHLDRGGYLGPIRYYTTFKDQPHGFEYAITHHQPGSAPPAAVGKTHVSMVMQHGPTHPDGYRIGIEYGADLTPEETELVAEHAHPSSSISPSHFRHVAAYARGWADRMREQMVRPGVPVKFATARPHQPVDYASALQQMRSANHRGYVQAIQSALDQMGMRPHSVLPVLHSMGDSARPGVATAVLRPVDPASAVYAAAWSGLLSGQNGMLSFRQHPDGKDRLYHLRIPGGGTDAAKYLDAAGIASRVMIPHGTGTRVLIHDPEGALRPAVASVARQFNTVVGEVKGTGHFIGGDDPEEARAAYRAVTRKYEQGASAQAEDTAGSPEQRPQQMARPGAPVKMWGSVPEPAPAKPHAPSPAPAAKPAAAPASAFADVPHPVFHPLASWNDTSTDDHTNPVAKVAAPDGVTYFVKTATENPVEAHIEPVARRIMRGLGFTEVPPIERISPPEPDRPQMLVGPWTETRGQRITFRGVHSFGRGAWNYEPIRDALAKFGRKRLADLFTAHWALGAIDRNPGNYGINDRGQIVPLDYGETFSILPWAGKQNRDFPRAMRRSSPHHDSLFDVARNAGMMEDNEPVRPEFVKKLKVMEPEIRRAFAEEVAPHLPPEDAAVAARSLDERFRFLGELLERARTGERVGLMDLPKYQGNVRVEAWK